VVRIPCLKAKTPSRGRFVKTLWGAWDADTGEVAAVTVSRDMTAGGVVCIKVKRERRRETTPVQAVDGARGDIEAHPVYPAT
jgi:hypothetical protein